MSLLLLLNSFRQIKFKSTISLLRSDNYGEKPPKANWLFGLLGIVLLGVAYYLAITIKQPIAAISFFFIAVILVILGTYLLMISGSVLLCKILQKKKSYYYKTNHFISVSSMAYRMKRNGAGLATICILATMVLVMISSTASLYIGAEDSINNSYPRDFAFSAIPGNLEQIDDETYNRFIDSIENKLEDAEIEHFNEFSYRTASLSGEIIDDRVNYVPDTVVNLENVCTFFIVPLSDYNRIMDSHETVPRGQAMMLCEGMSYSKDSIAFGNCKEIKIAKEMDEFISLVNSSSPITSRMILVINDEDMETIVQPILDEAPYDMTAITMYMQYYCDINDDDLVRLDSISSTLSTDLYSNLGIDGSNLGIKEYTKDDFYGTFGGLFYLGIILSIVFIVAAVLIIYYKQISEGYEDQSRFDIMQKVGITKKEIRRTINSQLLTIFFLPLVLAGVHMACAFPMITKMLNLFYLYDVKLFLLITLLSFVVFGIAYGVVYKMTSKAYYKIVSGGQN